MTLEIRTAAELIALDVAGRGAARRAAREAGLLQGVLWAFVERPEPLPVEEIVSALPAEPPERVSEALATLNHEDLIRIDGGRVDLAYPISAAPTSFVVNLGEGRGERYVCCAIDALGIAPMLGQPVRIRSQCHHCGAPMELPVDPSGPGPDAERVMVWAGTRPEDARRACDAF